MNGAIHQVGFAAAWLVGVYRLGRMGGQAKAGGTAGDDETDLTGSCDSFYSLATVLIL
ncbi:hypothetical protein D3C80_2118140 [compost metagenome]